MRRFWDARAREDAVYFVDNRQRYGEADLARFFAEAERDLERFLGPLGARIQAGDSVVEIGCGVGRLTRTIARRAERVVAIDVSEQMLARARELNPDLDNVDWRLGDGTSLAVVEDVGADVCLSAVVFQHVPDPAITLGYVREVGRVLRPGGWAALHVSNDPSVHRPRGGLAARLRALLRRGPRGQRHPAWLGSSVGLDDVRRAAAEGGLELARVSGEGTQYCCVLLRKAERGARALA
jgi:SAM-dependent methyltransferase